MEVETHKWHKTNLRWLSRLSLLESDVEQPASVDEQRQEDDLQNLSASRDLTEDERRVLAEIKHEAERDYELVDVDDDEVCILEDTGQYSRGFDFMEIEEENFHQFEESRQEEEGQELSRQLYPSVADAFQTDPEPEVILPHAVEPEGEGEWQDVAVSEMDSDEEQNVEDDDLAPRDRKSVVRERV